MIIALVGILFLLALCSGVEAGVFAINRVRLRQRARSGITAAVHLESLLKDPGRLSVTIAVTKTCLRVLALAVLFRLLSGFSNLLQTALVLLLIVPCIAIVCEFLPRFFFRKFPYPFLWGLSRCLLVLDVLLSPITGPFSKLGRALLKNSPHYDVRSLADVSTLRKATNELQALGAISPLQKHLLHSVLHARELPIMSLAVPLEEVPCVPASMEIGEVYRKAKAATVERFVVLGEGGKIVGSLRTFDLLTDKISSGRAQSYARRILEIPSQTGLLEALKLMRNARAPVAVVCSDKGALSVVFLEAIVRRVLLGSLAKIPDS